MSPLPVLRTEFSVLKLFCRKLPQQVGLVLVVMVAQAVILGVSVIAAVYGIFGSALNAGTFGLVLMIAALAVFYLACTTTVCAIFWRHADRNLLGGGDVLAGLPVWTLVKGALFSLAVLAGGGVLLTATLLAVPWRLQDLGLDPTTSIALTIIPFAIALLGVVLRLQVLLPLIALDNYEVGPAWRLILKITHGKSIPLLAALLFQVLATAPLWGLLILLGVADASAASALLDDVPLLVASLLIYGAVYAVVAALQAGVVRHFFGYSGAQEEAPQRLRANAPNSIYSQSPPAAGGLVAPMPVFDPSALEDADDVTAGLPAVYQPTAPPPMPDYATPAPTPAPEPPAWEFVEPPTAATGDPFSSFSEAVPPAPKPHAPPADEENDDPFSDLRV